MKKLTLTVLLMAFAAPAFATDYSADYNNDLAKKLAGCAAYEEAMETGFRNKNETESANNAQAASIGFKTAAGYYSGTFDMDDVVADAGNKLINDEIDADKTVFGVAIANEDDATLKAQMDVCSTEDVHQAAQYGYEQGQKQAVGQ